MPYPFEWDEHRRLYSFTTATNLTYELSFTKDENLNIGNADNPIDNIYHFVLAKREEDQNIKSNDKDISETIRAVVTAFFQNNINYTLVYTCDDEDNKGICRFVLFEKWYKTWVVPDYEKIDNIIELDDTRIFTSIILHKSNENYDVIIDRHKNIVQNYKRE
ncbi:DUF6169 family protein [Myroides odoratus]|uniref:Uncharacterized protein n=1 Tax=Myroides odoratus TaxID=256 RepID=A0A378RQG5_MYROD|nr:DUF6169 family protein [Myroides odoratus]QQU04190.1 hypothetical protein I6I89_02565 [Myroides odoratus]STZ28407.1 Uncharacterised protein [Myroides odoratus]